MSDEIDFFKKDEEDQIRFDKFFLDIVIKEAKKSPDPSTKCGCILVDPRHSSIISRGFNSVPQGVKLFDRLEKRPEKYDWVLHAEACAVANAAMYGNSTHLSWAYINWRVDGICECCSGSLIQAGISRIIGTNKKFPGAGNGVAYNKFGVTEKKFSEASIVLQNLDMKEDKYV